MEQRTAQYSRTTNETEIHVSLTLDGTGATDTSTGIPFFDHMLDQLGRHSGFDLSVKAKGDLEIDAHHTVEDVGIAIGIATRRQLEITMSLQLCFVCKYGGGGNAVELMEL